MGSCNQCCQISTKFFRSKKWGHKWSKAWQSVWYSVSEPLYGSLYKSEADKSQQMWTVTKWLKQKMVLVHTSGLGHGLGIEKATERSICFHLKVNLKLSLVHVGRDSYFILCKYIKLQYSKAFTILKHFQQVFWHMFLHSVSSHAQRPFLHKLTDVTVLSFLVYHFTSGHFGATFLPILNLMLSFPAWSVDGLLFGPHLANF